MRVLFVIFFLFFVTLLYGSEPRAFKIEATALGYTPSYPNTPVESRYHLELQHRSKQGTRVPYRFSLDLWGEIPQQTADWFDVPEAFLGLEGIPAFATRGFAGMTRNAGMTLRAGRILPEWAKNDMEGPIRKIFPKFIIDPLTETQDGWVGIQASYQKSLLGIELFYSPLFVPNRGGIKFQKDSEGRLSSHSRWLPMLFEEVKIGSGMIPLHYTLHAPSLGEILFKQSGLMRISLNARWLEVAILGARFFKTEATLKHDVKLHIQDETGLSGRVHLYPEFAEERLLGFQAGLRWGEVVFFHEAAYFSQESKLRGGVGFQIKLDPPPSPRVGSRGMTVWRWFPSFTTAIHLAKNFESEAPSPIPSRPEKSWISKATFRPLEKSELSLSYETDLSMKSRILKCGLDVGPFSRMKFGIGFDILSGNDNSYWGMYRANDRLWVKGSYVF